jgi:hypothetical protein
MKFRGPPETRGPVAVRSFHIFILEGTMPTQKPQEHSPPGRTAVPDTFSKGF